MLFALLSGLKPARFVIVAYLYDISLEREFVALFCMVIFMVLECIVYIECGGVQTACILF